MELKSLVEAILFAAQKPLSAKEIRALVTRPETEEPTEATQAFRKIREAEIMAAIDQLKVDHLQLDRSVQIQAVAGAFQLVTKPDFAPWLQRLYEERRSPRLSPAALETLAIIAYRQPITRADIESVRGVAVDGVMQTLLDRGLVTIVGRAEVAGRPMLYGSTRAFLEHFGLNDINQLPAMEELRRANIPASQPAPQPAPQTGPVPTEEPNHAEPVPTPKTD